jgi:hypothetical protein
MTRHLATAGLVFLTGAVLLVGGVPQTITALTILPGNPVLTEIQNLRPVGRDDLEILIASKRRGLRFGESGREWTDLGLAQLLLAREQGVPGGIKIEMVSQAIVSLKTGLALAPANPFAWTRLAYAQSLMTGPSPSVASALRMAMLTARYEPRLLFIRLELCLRSWSYFRTDDHELVFQQVRLAWRKNGKRLVDMAVKTGQVNVVRAALLGSRKDLSAFEKRLRKRAS